MSELIFFMHLPRTAGTTLNAVLRNNFAPEEVLSVYKDTEYARCREMDPVELDRFRLVQGHLMPESYEPPRLYGRRVRMFTFLRDPLDRIVSEYHFLKSWPANHLYAYLNGNRISFREYLTSRERLLEHRGKNFVTRCLAGNLFAPGISLDEELEQAKGHLEQSFCFVGVQERFDESLLLLAREIGLESLYYERRNALRAGYAADVSEEDRALAEALNAADRALYEYACVLFEQRVAAAGPGFAGLVRRFRHVNAGYQKICGLVDARLQTPEGTGPILRPKG
ncbi:MAG: sulfotransferase family protein [Desulfovibrionaceae bacterium]|nr:sulfotransferase family protein [Desulfovibrionaceae bacterium]